MRIYNKINDKICQINLMNIIIINYNNNNKNKIWRGICITSQNNKSRHKILIFILINI